MKTALSATETVSDPWLGVRFDSLNWKEIGSALNRDGVAQTGRLLSSDDCRVLADAYEADERYRSRVIMSKHGFGRGEYRYFAYPLPEIVQGLRERLYSKLAPIANAWNAALNMEPRFPDRHQDYLAVCHAQGQTRPTPLILKYAEGDYNCLHQDLYGDLVFPFQVAFLLSEPGVDFEGGEFVLTEQRPRMQSRAEVVSLQKGEGVIFPVRHRPVQGSKGVYRTAMRHGVSRIKRGRRFTLGIIFHDAA